MFARYKGASGKGVFTGELMSILARFMKDESGATAIEYGLIAAGISVAIIAVVVGLGSKLNTTFTSVSNALN
jgi:pilus assembly protein Flp/PilA